MRDTYIAGGLAIVVITIGIVFFMQDDASVSNASPSEETTSIPVSVSFTELAQGTKSSIASPANYLITSESQLKELMQIVGSKDKMPTVDFNKSYVAAVFAGEKPTDGYAIKVSKIEDTDVRTVTVTFVEPDNSCTKKSSATSPYALIELPKTSLVFTHQKEFTTSSCLQ
jgi:hypothetical protein